MPLLVSRVCFGLAFLNDLILTTRISTINVVLEPVSALGSETKMKTNKLDASVGFAIQPFDRQCSSSLSVKG